MSILFILFLLAGLCYALALASYAFALKGSRAREGSFYYSALFAGFALHTLALCVRVFETGSAPFANPYELLESIAWFAVLAEIFSGLVLKMRLSGIFFLPAAALFTLLPVMCPVFAERMSATGGKDPAGFLGALHAWFAVISYALMFAAAAFAAMDLVQRRSLKLRREDALSRSLMPLPFLERCVRAALYSAVFAMGISLVLGISRAAYAGVDFYVALKYAAGALLFAAQILLSVSIYKGRVQGAGAAKWAIGLFAFALVLLIPIELRSVL